MIDPWIFAFSFVTVAATIFMGFWSARRSRSASDFFVAGRSVSVGWNASAISGEYLSAASFMGVAGMVMSSGYDALWYPVCYACGYLFLLLFIAGPLRRFGAYTIPDFAEGRYDSPVFRKIAVVFVLFIGFFYTMPQMKGAGTTLAYVFKDITWFGQKGLPYWVGVVVVGAVITLNVALGGMKGITLVQAFQYWLKMFAISVPVFVLMSVYGGYGRQLGHNVALAKRVPKDLATAGARELENSPPGTNLFRLHTPQSLFTASPRWKLELMALVGLDNYRKLHLKGFELEGMSGRSDGQPIPLFLLASGYGEIVGKIVLVAATTEQLRTNVAWPTRTTVYGAKCLRMYKRVLEDSGIILVEETPTTLVFAHSTLLLPVAVPLPAKAPADASWLNPFGPLTTKAARAAKPTVRYGGPLEERTFDRTIGLAAGTIGFFINQAKSAVSPGRRFHQFGDRTWTAYEMFGQYVKLAAAGSKTSLIPRFSYRCSPALKTIEIPWTDRERQEAPQAAARMKSLLEDNGVTVLREGNVFTAFPTKDAVLVPIDPRPYALLYTYSLIIALVCGTAGLPHILVRFYTNPDGVAAKRTTMWVMILIGFFYVFPPVLGVMGRNLMPALYEGTGVNGTDGIVLKLPTVLHERFGALGSVLSGLTCAGAFAAFMSTFSGLLVSMTGALAHDVYGRILRPQSTPGERMKMFKFCAVIIGTVAVLLGTLVENFEINFMVGQAFAIAAASYFPLLFMSVWWRGMTTRGAATGMLTGGLLAVLAISLTSWTTFLTAQAAKFKALGAAEPGWFAALKPYSLTAFWAEHPLLRILGEQPAIWAVPLAITLMIVVSKLTRVSVPADIRDKMLVLHAPEALGLRQDYIRDHEAAH